MCWAQLGCHPASWLLVLLLEWRHTRGDCWGRIEVNESLGGFVHLPVPSNAQTDLPCESRFGPCSRAELFVHLEENILNVQIVLPAAAWGVFGVNREICNKAQHMWNKKTQSNTSGRKALAGLLTRPRVRNVGLTERNSGLSPLIWSGRMNSDIKDLLVGASSPVEQRNSLIRFSHHNTTELISNLWLKRQRNRKLKGNSTSIVSVLIKPHSDVHGIKPLCKQWNSINPTSRSCAMTRSTL